MANPEHLAKLREGVEAWNQWRSRYPKIVPDLVGSRLSGADLSRADLNGVNLSRSDLDEATLILANLSDAKLNHTNLAIASLSGADLTGADLFAATLQGAVLAGTNFFGADLTEVILADALLFGANLSQAKLDSADVTNATFDLAIFGNSDISSLKGLETVKHAGPSVIGIDTIYRSNGRIPESFLRGCGVPDDFIIYMKSLAANPIEFYSCFISYSTKDQAFADRLYADLQNKGVRCWFAPHDVQGGKKLHEQIDEAIRVHDKLLLILSPHSMESEWVKTEIAKARKREVRDKRRVLFPIRLAPFETLRDWECFDADTGKDSAREIREYFIPDFSNWKNHDSYQEAFQRLISDLKAQDTALK
jgi:hypothetical protein